MGFPFSYVLGDEGLEVHFGLFTIWSIRYEDIEQVLAKNTFWNEHYTNVWPLGRSVTIRRKTGMFKNFVINPEDRDEFVGQLEARVRHYRGR